MLPVFRLPSGRWKAIGCPIDVNGRPRRWAAIRNNVLTTEPFGCPTTSDLPLGGGLEVSRHRTCLRISLPSSDIPGDSHGAHVPRLARNSKERVLPHR